MSDSDPGRPHDLLGIKPVGEAVKIATEAAVRQAENFLTLICQPAAKEFGLLLKDQLKAWRTANLVRIANKAEEKLKENAGDSDMHAHPRIVTQVCETASLADDDEVQAMWAGLIASACTPDGQDDSNLVFVHLLGQLTANQAKLLTYLCENSKFYRDATTWLFAEMGKWNFREFVSAAGYSDANRFRTEASHLRQLGLIDIYLPRDEPQELRCGPTALALELYVRTQGSRDPITRYYKDQQPLGEDDDIVDYPNITARLSEGVASDLRGEFETPEASFSVGQERDSFFVGVTNTGLVPIHDSQLSVVIPDGEMMLRASFTLGSEHSSVLTPGEEQRWYLPLHAVHFMLGQPIKQFLSNRPPETYWVALEARGEEVGRVDSDKLQRFVQRFG